MSRKIYKNIEMKKLFFFGLIVLFFLTSCLSVKQIGKVNMISNRNVDPSLSYVAISTYAGGSKRELKKSKSKTIEDAVDQTVRKVPGGEFLMNAKIYLVKGQFIAVEGDVWGNSTEITYRGFAVGDNVTWKSLGVFKTGKIKSLKDDVSCLIETETGEVIEKKYDDITKSE